MSTYAARTQPVVTRPVVTRPVVVLPVGDFGCEVATHLLALLPQARVLPEPTSNPTQTGIDTLLAHIDTLLAHQDAIAVLASWRSVPALADLLDARSHSTRTPFLSLTLGDGAMTLGPIVLPGEGCCWRCWHARDLHARASQTAKMQRMNYYRDHPTEAPRGFLPSLALLGAAQLSKALLAVQSGSATAGESLRTDVVSRQITTGTASGLDHCDRCGLGRPLASRTYADLRLSLKSLWQQS